LRHAGGTLPASRGSGNRAAAWLAAALAAALALCGAAAPGFATDLQRKLQVGGRERSYALHVPPGATDSRAMPLVIVLHGGAGNGAAAAAQTGFSREADRSGFLVAYPDGTDRPRPFLNALGKPGLLTWNAGGCCGYAMENRVDDVAFLRAMLGEIERSHRVDRKRVYATGLSNGAMMAYRFACEASDVVAAVGIVAGVVLSPCMPAAPVSIIHIHGGADENVPVAGGIGRKSVTRTSYPAVADSLALWARADGCGGAPARSDAAPFVHLTDYRPCRNGTEIAYYLIDGGGHSWPGGERIAALLDAPSRAIAATPLIWRFFAAHPKP
jgi:polyhydroxybutyrate depolymerase